MAAVEDRYGIITLIDVPSIETADDQTAEARAPGCGGTLRFTHRTADRNAL
jgi:hypothetical protein